MMESLWRKRKNKNGQYINQNVRHDRQNYANLSEMQVITTNLSCKKKQISIKSEDLSIKSSQDYTKCNFLINIFIGS